MRILMLTCQYMPEVIGGAEMQCRRLSRSLVQSGHQVSVLTSRSSRSIARQECLDGVEVTRLMVGASPQVGGRQLPSMLWWIIKTIFWLGLRRNGFDVLHMHQAKANAFAGVLAGKLFGIPTLVKVGNGGPGFDFHTLERKRYIYGAIMARFVRRYADRVVALSTHLIDEIEAYGVQRRRIVLIPNGIEDKYVHGNVNCSTLRRRFGFSPDRIYLVFAGRLERQKQVDLLLDAFAELHLERPDISLVILGDGELRRALETQSAGLGTDGSVLFAGMVDNPHDYMSAADVFVLPSMTEGLSNALLEAMGAGLLPVASRVSGSVDLIVDGENGFLYEAGSRSELVTALRRAVDLTAEQRASMGEVARRTVLNGYTLDVVRDRYETIYREMSGDRIAAVAHGGPAASVPDNRPRARHS